jgi:hypothetical protein
MPERGANPVEWLRGLALSLERLAVQGVAGGAVRGAADELRAGVPGDLDARVRTLLRDGLAAIERLAEEGARSKASPLGAWSQTTAEGAVRGAIEELRRLIPEMQPTTQELLVRVKLWLDRSALEAEERAELIRAPADLARVAAAGAVAGATEQLGTALPRLAGPAAEFASRVGRGFARGIAEEVAGQLELAARTPLVRALIAGSAVVAGGAVLAALLAASRR